MTSVQQTLRNPSYRNWVKGALVLQFLRDGIQCFVDDAIQGFQKKFLNEIWARNGLAVGTVCNVCTTHNVLPCPTRGTCTIRHGVCNYHDNSDPLKTHKSCPSGICNDLQDIIYKRHRFRGPSWHNTNAQLWCSNSWEIAKCYMTSSGYTTVTSAVQTDFPGLVSVVINLKDFQNIVVDNLSRPNNLFCQARTIQNDILHRATFELTDVVLNDYIDTMVLLLNDPGHLAMNRNAQIAVTMLKQLRTDSMTVTNEDEREIRDQALRAIDERKEEVILSIEEKGDKTKEEVKLEDLLQVTNIQEKAEAMKKEMKEEVKLDSILQVTNIQEKAGEMKKEVKQEGILKVTYIQEKGEKMKEEVKQEVKQEGLLQITNIQEEKEKTIRQESQNKFTKALKTERDAIAETKRQAYINEKTMLKTEEIVEIAIPQTKMEPVGQKVYLDTDNDKEWENCLQANDKEGRACQLVESKRWPNGLLFAKCRDVFGEKSKTFKYVCDELCDYIKNSCSGVRSCWVGRRARDRNIVLVVVTDKQSQINTNHGLEGYDILYRRINEVSKEGRDTMYCPESLSYKPSLEEYQEMKHVLEKYTSSLIESHSNITMISPSFVKSTNFGKKNKAYIAKCCICLYVHIKSVIPIGEDEFPSDLDKVPVDVREGSFKLLGLNADDKQPSVMTGATISGISHKLRGTLGPVFECGNDVFCITCCHVLLPGDFHERLPLNVYTSLNEHEENVCQPRSDYNDVFGEIHGALYSKGEGRSAGMEIVVVKIISRHPTSGNFPDITYLQDVPKWFSCPNPIAYTSGKNIGSKKELFEKYRDDGLVIQVGSSSGIGSGIIRHVHDDVLTTTLNYNSNPNFCLRNQIEVLRNDRLAFAEHGDSGAMVGILLKDGKDSRDVYKLLPFGILEGETTNGTYAVTPIWEILAALTNHFQQTIELKQFNEEMDVS